jgi:gamma-glutamylcyclotransferase (GGCT)/AIG2-like uncharacterized protein YtfP
LCNLTTCNPPLFWYNNSKEQKTDRTEAERKQEVNIMRKNLYAAYAGDLCLSQMEHNCPTAQPIAKSWLHDYKLVFQGSPKSAHATVIPADGKAVPVVIWEISEQDEAALDKSNFVQTGYYTKERMTLEVAGEMQEAMIYIMRPSDYGMPSKAYLDLLTRGYLDFNFPTTVLEEALSDSYEGTVRYENQKEEMPNGN